METHSPYIRYPKTEFARSSQHSDVPMTLVYITEVAINLRTSAHSATRPKEYHKTRVW